MRCLVWLIVVLGSLEFILYFLVEVFPPWGLLIMPGLKSWEQSIPSPVQSQGVWWQEPYYYSLGYDYVIVSLGGHKILSPGFLQLRVNWTWYWGYLRVDLKSDETFHQWTWGKSPRFWIAASNRKDCISLLRSGGPSCTWGWASQKVSPC